MKDDGEGENAKNSLSFGFFLFKKNNFEISIKDLKISLVRLGRSFGHKISLFLARIEDSTTRE